MQHQIERRDPVGVHQPLDRRPAAGGGDVLDDGVGPADRRDGVEVDPEDERPHGGVPDGDLHPPARGSAKVEDGPRRRKDAVLGIYLEELEGGAGPEPLLLRQPVELVLPLLPLRVSPHFFPARVRVFSRDV